MMAGSSLVERQSAQVFYTWTAQSEAVPLEIVGGQGAHFRTADGAEWLDLGSMTWNANLGHGQARMRQALVTAAEKGLLVTPSAAFADKALAGERLMAIAPVGMRGGKAFLCLSGAEANENAVKMARLVTGRRKVVYRSRSYHGATLGMLSLSGDPRRRFFDPGLPDGVEWADSYSAAPCPGDLESVFQSHEAGTIAAVLLEGVVGANGVVVPPRGYFRRVRQLCDSHGALLIADEVLSGFGRTGRWFAIDHDDVTPDLITCAKGLTGGYAPGGAVLVNARVARHFDDHVLSCGLTAYAHPLTCAAIAAAIEIYQDDELIPRAAALGDVVNERLSVLATRQPFVSQYRGVGLLWAIDLTENSHPAGAPRMRALAAGLRRRHLHVAKRDNTVFIAPPLVIRTRELLAGLDALEEALVEAWRESDLQPPPAPPPGAR